MAYQTIVNPLQMDNTNNVQDLANTFATDVYNAKQAYHNLPVDIGVDKFDAPYMHQQATPAQIQQVTTKHAQQKDVQSLVPQPDYSTQPDNKYTAFALQLQKAQAENGDGLPFTAPTAFSEIEDALFSALTTYAIGRLLGANANHSWGMGLEAAVKNFEQDQQMKERYPMIQNLLKQGYSYPAVMEWYRTGKTDAIEAEGKNLSDLKKQEMINTTDLQKQQMADETATQNANTSAKANTDSAYISNGFNPPVSGGAGEDSLGNADAFEQYVHSHENGKVGQEDYRHSGHFGTHQQSQDFYNQYGGKGDVRNASYAQEAQVAKNFYNIMKKQHPDWTDAQIASAYHDGPTATANAIAEGKANNTAWWSHLGTQGRKYVSDLTAPSSGPTMYMNKAAGKAGTGSPVYTTPDGKMVAGQNGQPLTYNDADAIATANNINPTNTSLTGASGYINRKFANVNNIVGNALGDAAAADEQKQQVDAGNHLDQMAVGKAVANARAKGQVGIDREAEVDRLAKQGYQLDYSSPERLHDTTNNTLWYVTDGKAGYPASQNSSNNLDGLSNSQNSQIKSDVQAQKARNSAAWN